MKVKEIIDESLDLLEMIGLYFLAGFFIIGLCVGNILFAFYIGSILFKVNIIEVEFIYLLPLIVYSIFCWILYFYATFRD
jgi:hypothetical protein